MVSYGLAYGMEAFGLAQRLGIETGEAAEILGSYFAAFPLVRELMDRSVAEARARGYTVTLLGRRRPLPDLSSPNRGLRMAAERQAMNAGIQGLAADLFKLALVRLDAALEDGGSRRVSCSRCTTRCSSRFLSGTQPSNKTSRTSRVLCSQESATRSVSRFLSKCRAPGAPPGLRRRSTPEGRSPDMPALRGVRSRTARCPQVARCV